MPGGTLPCWPDEPFYEQLVQGEALKASGRNLESDWTAWTNVGESHARGRNRLRPRGARHPGGRAQKICRPLLDAHVPAASRWSAMIDSVKTVQTQSMQLWFNREIWDLGWEARVMPSQTGSPVERTVLDAYQDPYNSWADMTHLLPAETWPDEPGAPKSLVYLCGTLTEDRSDKENAVPPPGPNPAFPAHQLARVRGEALAGEEHGSDLAEGGAQRTAARTRLGSAGGAGRRQRGCPARRPVASREHRRHRTVRADGEGQHEVPNEGG